MRALWKWTKRLMLLSIALLVGSNVLLPAVARAQFVSQGGASATQVLAALVGQEVAATRYTAAATTGAAFSSSATLPAVLDMVGADNQIGTDGAQILLGPAASTTVTVKIGANVRCMGNGTCEVNGLLDQYNAGYLARTIGGAARVDDAEGFNVTAQALGTCSSGREGDIVRDTLAGGTSGDRTRLCMCTSDGSGTPVYTWVNLTSSTNGTATTCPN